jgi:rhodanese-related sulfurtransferase
MNKKGPDNFMSSIWSVPLKLNQSNIKDDHLIIDTREYDGQSYHLPNSVNIMARDENDKFETWLGAIVKPNEKFYLIIKSIEDYQFILDRVARIGYEQQIVYVMTLAKDFKKENKDLDLDKFKANPNDFTIIDIRNYSEVAEGKIFENALHHPLNNLRESAKDIPDDKPIVVHCAGGYRSRAGYGIIKSNKPKTEVYDLSYAVSDFNS